MRPGRAGPVDCTRRLPASLRQCFAIASQVRRSLIRIIHIFEDNKSLLCYKDVVRAWKNASFSP
jgi:hypothetical protein